MRSKLFYVFFAFILTLSLLIASTPNAAENPSPTNLPKIIGWTSYGTGSGSYIMSAIFAEAMEDVTGSKVKVTPAGGDVGKLLPIKKGEAHVAFLTGSGSYWASSGAGPFSAADWGPQRLRIIWKGLDSENSFTVKGTSRIKTGADIKGKKIAFIPGNVSVNKINEAYLAFHNLTFDDMIKVAVSGFGASLKAIQNGTIDISMGGTVAAGVWTMHKSPGGVRFIPMPADDKAGWKRLQGVCPFMYPRKMAGGLAAVDPKVAVEAAGYPAMMPMTYADINDNLTYALTKTLHTKYDWYKDRYAGLDKYTLENCVKGVLKLAIPMHPGSVKYLKEIGAWTPEHEKWQSERLRIEEERMKHWQAALAEAKAKGIPIDINEKRWTDLWASHLALVK